MDGGGCALIFHQFKNVCTPQDGIPLSSASLNKRSERGGEGGRGREREGGERGRERDTDRQSETERDREEQEQEGGKKISQHYGNVSYPSLNAGFARL